MKTLFDNEILKETLFNDIKNVIDQDNKYNSTFLTSSLFGICSYLGNNKIYLKLGNEEPVSTGMMIINIGNSGCGKSYSQKIANKVFEDRTIYNSELQEVYNDFAQACKYYKESEDYKTNVAGGKSKIDLQNEFADRYYFSKLVKDDRFRPGELQFSVIPVKMPKYFIKDFTTQSLPELYNRNPRQALYVYSEEITDIDEKITQTSGARNTNAFKLNMIDGGMNSVDRKYGNEIASRGYCTIIANSTPSSFSKYYTPEFYGSGLGYRCFLMIDDSTNEDNDKYLVKFYEQERNNIQQYKMKVEELINNFLNIVDSYQGDIVYNIKTPELITLFNTELMKVYSDVLNDSVNSGKLNASTVSELKDRIKSNVVKTILTLHLLNASYDNKMFSVEYGAMKEITAEGIIRGFKAYRVLLNNSINLLSGNITNASKLTPNQKKVIDLMEIGDTMATANLFALVAKNKIVGSSAFYKFLNDVEFKKYVEWNKVKETVRRLA